MAAFSFCRLKQIYRTYQEYADQNHVMSMNLLCHLTAFCIRILKTEKNTSD